MTAGPLHLMDAVPAHTPGPVVQFVNVRKRFGRLDVLRGVDLTIARSRITAILGPNGAGKTTLIKCLLGLTRPDEGTMEVGGRSPALEPAARATIGYAPQAPRFPDNLPGRRILTMLELLRETPGVGVDPIFRSFGLDAELDKPARILSGGTRQKLSLALALAFRPTLLILDEPTAGLDPVSSGHLKDRLRQERAAGTTVVLTS
ncbi:MAG: ABC transporter ATP-binding protein, partial [Gemmatimonadales bacterium]